MINELNT